MPAPTIRLISEKELPVLASFLADIFFDNAVFTGIFSEPKTRKERLIWLFSKNLLLQNAEKNTWVMVNEAVTEIATIADIIATATFLPSTERKSSIAEYIKKGLLAMPFKYGFTPFKNLLEANKVNEHSIQYLAGTKPYWYLAMVAVATEHRRKGIARQLISNVIMRNTDAQTFQEGYKAILLSTQSEANVDLYKKLGFAIIAATAEKKYTSWFMKKVLPEFPVS